MIGRLGLDFLVAALKYVSHQLGKYKHVSTIAEEIAYLMVQPKTYFMPMLSEQLCRARASSPS